MTPRSDSPAALLPAVDRLLKEAPVARLARPVALRAVREVLDETRRAALAGEPVPPLPALVDAVLEAAAAWIGGGVPRVLNATGVVLHTNLGRAPLAPDAVAALQEAARGYAAVEFDLASGERGERLAGVVRVLKALAGAEDAVVVNNNAAAVLLALTALARGRAVVISRGEEVEIGGSFRIPEVVASGGARLVEVGTTNRTRLSDYEAALSEDVAGILKVHTSNFRIVGFTERPERRALAALAAARGLWLLEDLGSGNLVEGFCEEPTVVEVVASGVDVVTFSGDKLLGGPQCGIAVGRRDLVTRMRRHPLYRALRVDKLVLATLDATLRMHLAGRVDEIPGLACMRLDPARVRVRAEALAAGWADLGLSVTVESVEARAGGGALPEQPLASWAVAIRGLAPEQLAAMLRAGSPPVVVRVAEDAVRLDPRTLLPGEDEEVSGLVRAAVARVRGGVPSPRPG
ncbi:MAG: L-seryl-tRNA(Sec) selenium transferase [Deltaproteobacteria bacterium]|nr:L-seryl-tRNA(Sec) selenium transferase [Deltaproteobacteria bacterium]